MNLKNKRILVIGGAGFIGSHTVEKLLKYQVSEILIYDNFIRGTLENLKKYLKDQRFKIISNNPNILDRETLDNAMKNIDIVLHFAALWLLECHEFPQKAFDVNIKGTFNVIDLCVKNNIKKLIFSSSASVYGDSIENKLIKETHPLNNKNFYGSTKIACEAILSAYHYRYNLNFIALRYMNVYGPGQDYKGAYIAVIMKMLDDIEKGYGPTIIGTGNETFDFISVEDCAIANIRAAESTSNNQFINICTGRGTSLLELAHLLLFLTNCSKTVQFKKNNNPTLVKNRIGDPRKALNEINFKAQKDFRKGLVELIEWRNKIKNT